MFGPPFIIAFVLPGFVIGDAGRIGFKFFALVSFYIETEEIMVAKAALFAFQVACFLHALCHDKFRVADARRFDGIIHSLHFRLIDFLGRSLESSGD